MKQLVRWVLGLSDCCICGEVCMFSRSVVCVFETSAKKFSSSLASLVRIKFKRNFAPKWGLWGWLAQRQKNNFWIQSITSIFASCIWGSCKEKDNSPKVHQIGSRSGQTRKNTTLQQVMLILLWNTHNFCHLNKIPLVSQSPQTIQTVGNPKPLHAAIHAKVTFLSRAWAACVSVFVLPKQNYHNQVPSLLSFFSLL